MKSGLRDRNNAIAPPTQWASWPGVSMKSGLRDRNNFLRISARFEHKEDVSMKSGLRDRNNVTYNPANCCQRRCLNEVRS